MKKKVHVIHHTHWDFEWYFTTNESFVQLAYHMDEVMQALENNQITHYLLDGQMSILDEYLQIFPENKDRIKQLVTSGRLQIGPWYTQTDELLVAGESIIRNLNLGIDLANDLGGYMNIGYLPDSFGQGKDMPKIYNGLGIKHAVFWRGVPNSTTIDREFNWASEDGSTVLVSNIKDGYFVGVGLIYDENYQDLMNTIEAGATSSELVLPVGGDQRYVDFDLRERIALYNSELADYEFVESTYADFFEAIQESDLQNVSGEFISSSVSKIHRSIYSSRYDHKYLHDKVERRMIYQVEPLMVMAEQWEIVYKQGLIDRIWKLLNKSQAHDSAGGCNSDQTNKIVLDRLIEADQLSYSIVDYLTRKLAESRADANQNDLTVYNTLPWPVKKVITVTLSTKYEYLDIYQGDQLVESETLRTIKENSDSIKRVTAEMDPNKFYYIHTVALQTTIPAFSFVNYQIREQNRSPQLLTQSTNYEQELLIENESYQLSFVNGALVLKEKKSNQSYDNFLVIEDSGDEGDTYDYSPPYEDELYHLNFEQATATVQKGKLTSTLTLSGHWFIASELEARAKKIRDQQINYILTIQLKKESKRIDCHLEIDNKACDHRMRAIINVPYTNEFSYVNTPFGIAKREVEDRHLNDWRKLGWREEPTAIFPMLHYVNTHTDQQSVTIFSKGIKEYQIVGDHFNQMALTLFRSVGFLGRPDLLRRPGIASGNEFKAIPTPDSQLLKKLTFKFAIQLEERYDPAKLMSDYLDYSLSIPYYQIQELNRFTTTLKYFVSNPLEQKVSVKRGPELVSDTLVFSSLRKASHSRGYDIRLYNPQDAETVHGGKIILPKKQEYEYVDLKGLPLSKRFSGNEIDLAKFEPGEIKTIRII